MNFHMCSIHGYAYLPDNPDLYEVINSPPLNLANLCKECSDVMIQRGIDFPEMKGSKVWFNVTTDRTQRSLMIGRYSYLRLRVEKD